jgi:YesN/AraC family two-component response regulator
MNSITVGPSLPSVLIVDDEVQIRTYLRDALEATARVIEAADGERALEILQTRADSTIDLALVDHVLPKCSGLEVLRVARHRWPWIPVVIITGFSSEDLAVQAFREGARDYLRKPIELPALLHTVGALARTKPTTLDASPGHPHMQRALTFIADHFTDALSLDDVARAARLSRYHFCRLFRQETGMTFLEYLRGVRVRRAKALLADRHLRITEVAYGVGFSDLSHFDRTFRKIVGLSPSEYRASLKPVEPWSPHAADSPGEVGSTLPFTR